MAAVDSGVTATALGRVTLLSVPHAELERLVEREPRHLGPLARLPMGQFALVLEAMEQASRPTAANRVAAKLLWLDAIQRETDEAAASQPLPISQAQLAAMTGLSRQSVNCVLRDLARAGALAVAFKEVRILDRERLTQAAGDAP